MLASPVEPERLHNADDGRAGAVLSAEVEPLEIVTAELVTEADRPRRGWLVRCWSALGRGLEWCFGVVCVIVFLAVLATVPVLQFISLGYLLEASGRVARNGKLRDGYVGVRKAARFGSAVLGTWLVLLPVRLVSDMWDSARIIDPSSTITHGWRIALVSLTVLAIVHVAWACFRGGRLRSFLWPAPVRLIRRLRSGGTYVEARDRLWEFVTGLRLPHFFWLGLRGFAGAVAWLLGPVTLLIVASQLRQPFAVAAGLLGATLLMLVILYLPFLQANFALSGRWPSLFDVAAVRAMFRRAPVAFWFALVSTLVFALPLYLLKAELVPREAAWLPSLVFVAFIFPARLLTGWSMGRARRRETSRFFLFRWGARLAILPVAAMYVLVVYFTQFVSWYGTLSLYEQHAFLVPVPFLGL